MGSLLGIAIVVATLFVLYTFAQKWTAATRRRRPPPPPEPAKPHATFDGGERYATADERLRIETDGPSAGGEGLLMAIVDALRARGVTTNPVEPESYGYMTVITIDGEDIVLRIGSWGRELEWSLFIESPTGRLPPQIDEALRSLEDIHNVQWK